MSRSTAAATDPTPDPGSTVTRRTAVDAAPRGAGPNGVLLDYFASPTPETLALEAAIGSAYEEGRVLYGDEDSDAWLAALENGTHPLCRIKTVASPPG